MAGDENKGSHILRLVGYFFLSWVIVAAVCAFGTWLMYGLPSTGGMPALIIALGVGFMCFREAKNYNKLLRFSLIGGLCYVIVYCCMINAGNIAA